MATIYERNSGTYGANFYENGNRARFSLRTKDRREALRRIEELEEAHESGLFDPFDFDGDPMAYEQRGASLTFSQAFEQFAKGKRREGMKESSVSSYRTTWDILTRQAGPPEQELGNMDASVLGNVIHDPDVAKSTRHKRFRHLRSILNHLGAEDLLEGVTEPSRADSTPTPVQRRDLGSLTAELKKDYRQKRRAGRCRPGQLIWQIPMWRFVFYTGLRRSELARLRWKDVDVEAGRLRLRETKSGSQQTVPLVSKAAEALRHAPKPRGPEMYVWRAPYADGRFERSPERLAHGTSRTFTKIRRKCDAVTEEYTLHDLRAGFATHLASNGLGAHEIKAAMRHKNVRTSEKYVRVANSDLRDSMEGAFS
jgi:integrase